MSMFDPSEIALNNNENCAKHSYWFPQSWEDYLIKCFFVSYITVAFAATPLQSPFIMADWPPYVTCMLCVMCSDFYTAVHYCLVLWE